MNIFDTLKSLKRDVWYKIPANKNQNNHAPRPAMITVERHDAGKALTHHYNYWTRKNMKVDFVFEPEVKMPVWDAVNKAMTMQSVVKINMEISV